MRRMKKYNAFYVEHVKKPIYEFMYKVFFHVNEFSKKRMDGFIFGPQIKYEKPLNIEKENRNRKIGVWCFVAIILVAIIMLSSYFAKYYFAIQNSNMGFDEWNSSAGSFWGALFGAFVTGIATVITTILVIERSYKIDYHRERLDVLPVLDMRVVCEKHLYNIGKSEQELQSMYAPKKIVVAPGRMSEGDECTVYAIKNVGRGIAYRIKTVGFFLDEWEEAREQGIVAEKEELLLLSCKTGKEPVYLTFYDLYENKYKQKFVVYEDECGISITTYPPELVKKTNRIRYTQ